MRDFDAVITRDGTVHHLPWGSHLDIIAHYGIRENVSLVRQNYWEYDIRTPFTDGIGLQARGVEEPPGRVVRAAERLTERLQNWHMGRDLRSIPKNWGDAVEHVYELRGSRAPKYLNGRGGVYFTGVLKELRDGRVRRLIGTARVELMAGAGRVDAMWGSARVDEMRDDSSVGEMRESAQVGLMRDRAVVELICQSASVEEMRDSSRVMIMHGSSRVLALYGSALCARGCDGVVSTPDRRVRKRAVLSAHERWKKVKVVEAGESVFA